MIRLGKLYHLHDIANDVSFGQLVTPLNNFFLPPLAVEVFPVHYTADPVQWDREGEAMSSIEANSPNRNYEVCGWELNSKQSQTYSSEPL